MAHHGTPQILTSGKEIAVRVCDCGVVHLHLGASTIHVSPDLLPVLVKVLRKAEDALKQAEHLLHGVREEASFDHAGNIIYGSFQKPN